MTLGDVQEFLEKSNSLTHVEVSAKTGQNVKKAFHSLIHLISANHLFLSTADNINININITNDSLEEGDEENSKENYGDIFGVRYSSNNNK